MNDFLEDVEFEWKPPKFVIDEIGDDEPIDVSYERKRAKGQMTRNGVKYYKCKTKYIYKSEKGYYAYRLYDKTLNVNTFVEKDIETKTAFRTEKQAEDALKRHIIELHKNITYKNNKITFGAFWEALQSKLTKEESTMKKYNSVYNQHVKHEFGHKKLQEITYADINYYLEKLYKSGDGRGTKQNGYSYSYVESILKFFWLVFNNAFADKIISADDLKLLTDNIKMPKNQEEKNIRILTSEEIQKIYELLKDTDYLLPFLVSLYTGARPAEAFAIRFSDFDYEEKTLNIDKQIVEFDGVLTVKSPKTFSRVVDIPDFLVEEAKKREALILKAKEESPIVFETNRKKVFYDFKDKNGLAYLDDDNIMIDTKGRYNAASSFQYYAKIIRKDICIYDYKYESFSFYTFRKTALSIMASHSIPIGALMRITGHKKNDTLFKYYYSDENEFAQRKIKETVNSMNGIIKKDDTKIL